MMGRGDACHFGFSASAAPAVSFATNSIDVDYLEYGPPSVLRHMKFVERLQQLERAKVLEGYLRVLSIPLDWVRLALNDSPPPLVCALFHGLRDDLRDGPHAKSKHATLDRDEPGSYGDYAAEYLERLGSKDGICDQILHKMHASKNMLAKYYEDTEEGGRNLHLCAHMSHSEEDESEEQM